jgi:hypothetical protein
VPPARTRSRRSAPTSPKACSSVPHEPAPGGSAGQLVRADHGGRHGPAARDDAATSSPPGSTRISPSTTQLSVNATRTARRGRPGGGAMSRRARAGGAHRVPARPASPARDLAGFEYLASGTSSDLNVDESKRTFFSQGVELNGAVPSSPTAGCARTCAHARSSSTRRSETGPAGADEIYRSAAGSAPSSWMTRPRRWIRSRTIPSPVPALFDRDRDDAPRSINLGSTALRRPRVRRRLPQPRVRLRRRRRRFRVRVPPRGPTHRRIPSCTSGASSSPTTPTVASGRSSGRSARR